MRAKGHARTVLVAAIACTAAVIGAYLALGGATYKPLETADPCEPRPEPSEERPLAEDLALSALDGAACSLRVPREQLVLALATPEGRSEFAERYKLADETIEAAVDAGLERAIDDAQSDDRISPVEAVLLREAANALPTGLVIDALGSSAGRSVLEVVEELVGEATG